MERKKKSKKKYYLFILFIITSFLVGCMRKTRNEKYDLSLEESGGGASEISIEEDIEFVTEESKESTTGNESSIIEYVMETYKAGKVTEYQLPVNEVDWKAYEKLLSHQEYLGLMQYMDIFDGKSVSFENWWSDEVEQITFAEFEDKMCTEEDRSPLLVDSIAVKDITNDGTMELIIKFSDHGGIFIIVHRENDDYYMQCRGIKSFLNLQNDGMFIYAGGGGLDDVVRLSFLNDHFEEEKLGCFNYYYDKENYECLIGEKSVTYEEYQAWLQEVSNDPLPFYPPIPYECD